MGEGVGTRNASVTTGTASQSRLLEEKQSEKSRRITHKFGSACEAATQGYRCLQGVSVIVWGTSDSGEKLQTEYKR